MWEKILFTKPGDGALLAVLRIPDNIGAGIFYHRTFRNLNMDEARTTVGPGAPAAGVTQENLFNIHEREGIWAPSPGSSLVLVKNPGSHSDI